MAVGGRRRHERPRRLLAPVALGSADARPFYPRVRRYETSFDLPPTACFLTPALSCGFRQEPWPTSDPSLQAPSSHSHHLPTMRHRSSGRGDERRLLPLLLIVFALAAPLSAQKDDDDYTDYGDEAGEDHGQYVDLSRRNKAAASTGSAARSQSSRRGGGGGGGQRSEDDSTDHWARYHPDFRRVTPGDVGSFCHRGSYRSLSPSLQGEHQCALLEAIQNDGYGSRREQGDRHREVVSLLNGLGSAVDKLRKDMAHMTGACSTRQPAGRPIVPVPETSTAPPQTVTYSSNQSNFAAPKDLPVKTNCYHLMRSGVTHSGVYPISVGNKVVLVYCDMRTEGGGWTVLQHRNDSEVSFNRKWSDYSRGFGNPNADYWLGNDHLSHMTREDDYELRVDLWDWSGGSAHAKYSYFRVDDASKLFALRLGNYSGGAAGDALGVHHRDAPFSTSDSDNDRDRAQSCAALESSGWWFNACSYANLNGPYVRGGRVALGPAGGGVVSRGVLWQTWKNDFGESMRRARMAIRPTAARRGSYEGRRATVAA